MAKHFLFLFLFSAIVLFDGCTSKKNKKASVGPPAKPASTATLAASAPPAPDAGSGQTNNEKVAAKEIVKSPPVLIRGARIYTAAGSVIANGYILMQDGLIKKVGEGDGKSETPKDAEVIDAAGRAVTPGLIDGHSHLGVYSEPGVWANADGNEMTRPVTSDVWAEHAFNPQDPGIWRALASGVTTVQVLPGSANLIGGRSFIAKLAPKVSAREMAFPGAGQGLKMACGENPKGTYENKGGPMTRMGIMAGFRSSFQRGIEYRRRMQKYERAKAEWDEKIKNAKDNKDEIKKIGDPPDPPDRDFGLETISKIFDEEGNDRILVHIHCYRADEMSILLDIAKEFGFKIRSFEHGLEAYKIRGRLAEEGVAVTTWPDWWGFKMEAFDGIPQSIAMLEKAGVKVIIKSDDAAELRHLNQEAAKAVAGGLKAGLGGFSEDIAIKWVTKNPAWDLGIDDKVGTLEPGKMADVVLWNMKTPFSVYAHPEKVFIDGRKIFDRVGDGGGPIFPLDDFELGIRKFGLGDGHEFIGAEWLKSYGLAFPVKKPQEAKMSVPSNEAQARIKIVKNSFAVKDARVEVGDRSVLEKATVVVLNGKIQSVGANLNIPQNIPVIDAAGKVLTPGLFVSRSQLGLAEVGGNENRNVDSSSFGMGNVAPDFRAIDSFNPGSVRIPVERDEGITTAVAAPRGGLIYGTGFAFDLVDEEDFDIGKLAANQAAAMFGGIGENAKMSVGQSRSGVWLRFREIFDDARWFKKNAASFSKAHASALGLSPIHLQALAPVINGTVPFVVDANRASDIRAALRLKEEMKKRGEKLRLVIAGAAEAWLVADELRKADVPVILSPSAQAPDAFESLRARDDSAALLDQKGVKVIINTAGENLRRLRQEAGIAVSYGMDYGSAIRAITLAPAEIYGKSKEVGSIAPGKRANLVLWSGDPLELFTISEKVWIDGKEMNLDNRQKELARRYLGQ